MSWSTTPDDPLEPHDWHYLSAIPLAPAPPAARRTSFSPPRTLRPTPPIQRADRPDVPYTPQLDPSPVMSGGATFDIAQRRSDASIRARSPPRPPRPSRPDQALMFNAPRPLVPLELSGEERAEAPTVTRLDHPSLEASPPMRDLPGSPSHDPLAQEALLPPVTMVRTRSSRRKPVPLYLPDIKIASPLEISQAGSPEAGPASRLGVSGFEALLARRQQEGQLTGDEEGRVVWSPRADLGLAAAGVTAREARKRRDEERYQLAVEQDVGDWNASRFPPSSDVYGGRLIPMPPAEHVHVSPRGTRARVRQTTVEDLLAPPSSAPGSQPPTPRTPSVWSNRHRRFVSVEDGADADVRAARAGPQLRRGSKRLSEVASVTDKMDMAADEANQLEDPRDASTVTNPAQPSQRRPSTFVSRVLSQPSTTSSRSVLRRGDTRFGAASSARKARVRSEGDVLKDRFEVVVLDPRKKEDADSFDGDWERLRTETTCRPERMNWSMCDYGGRFPRLLHLLYPLAVFAHVPATLFLDFNLIYVLCQLARNPAVPSPTSRNIATRALVNVPAIEPSTGWWVAVSVYAACTAAWFFGVLLWKELGWNYYAQWKSGDRSVEIEKIYAGAASFNMACLRSYSHFSFFWRIRLAPFTRSSPIKQAVQGSTWLDGFWETASWYRQNWPTVLLLVPRAGLTVAILLLYSTTAYGTTTSTTARDTSFFDSDGTLSRFAAAVLLTNAAWAAWRLLVLLAALIMSSLPRLAAFFPRRTQHVSLLDRQLPGQRQSAGSLSTSSRRPSVMYATWRTRRQRRIRTAILACLGGTPLRDTRLSADLSPVLSKSPYVTGSLKAKGGVWPVDSKRVEHDTLAMRVEHDPLRRRGSVPLAGRGRPSQQQESPLASHRKAQASQVAPRDAGAPSPLIQFSPATPPQPHWRSPAPALVQLSGVQPRRASNAAGMEEVASGDAGQSVLHRRMRSLQHEDDDGFIVFPSTEDPISPRTIPSRTTAGNAGPRNYASVGETNPRALLPPTILSSPRPPLVSRFSAFSSPYGSTAASTPQDERSSPDPTSSSPSAASTPSLRHAAPSWDEARLTLLRTQVGTGQLERNTASPRLGGDTFRSVSAPVTSGAGRPTYSRALGTGQSSEDARGSHAMSAGGHSATHSDESTVRGASAGRARSPEVGASSSAVAPVPAAATVGGVPGIQLGTPPAERDEESSFGDSTPEREGGGGGGGAGNAGGGRARVPLGFSRGSGSASFDLSAYNSPDLTSGDNSGQFDRTSPAMWQSDSL